jgi:hypothetical protein
MYVKKNMISLLDQGRYFAKFLSKSLKGISFENGLRKSILIKMFYIHINSYNYILYKKKKGYALKYITEPYRYCIFPATEVFKINNFYNIFNFK